MRKRQIAIPSLAAVVAAVFINSGGSDDAPEKVNALSKSDQKAELAYSPFAMVADDVLPENEVGISEAPFAEEIEKGVIADVSGDRYAVWDRLNQAKEDGDLEDVLFYEITNAQNIGDEAWHLLSEYASENNIQQPLLNIKGDIEAYLANMGGEDLEMLSRLYFDAFDFQMSAEVIFDHFESDDTFSELVNSYKRQLPSDLVSDSVLEVEDLTLHQVLDRLEGAGVKINHDAYPQVEKAWVMSNEGLAFGSHIYDEKTRMYGEDVTHAAPEKELNTLGELVF